MVDARAAPVASHPPAKLSASASLPVVVSSDPVDSSNLWERCRTGYTPLGDPNRDVLQLGLMCGPATGMRPQQGRAEGTAPGEVTQQWEAKTGECFRVVFAAEAQVAPKLELSTSAPHQGAGEAARLAGPEGLALIAPGASALCMSAPGQVALRLETRGSGRYAYQIFKRR